ncbi:hypothetical protein M408DRAFT_279555 [Serendipita vermifera MAFF 305830]|uniref:Uncharacterized protein n=1 Tax=Serendipita vermifera MAFF 305830 TaxID=933852 RepID=A0A0C3ARV7_SERVB|nr:hypothetical protein M408DRAFT_279555 [Serendipita vermifera MAFF 305830]
MTSTAALRVLQHAHSRRFFSNSARLLQTTPTTQTVAASVAPIVPVAPVVVKKRAGGIRGGIVGFLFGFSLASAFASYHLLEEYRLASSILQSSVQELQTSTQRVSAHVRRIETVEKELKALAERTAEKTDVTKLRAEMKQIYDGLHIEFLDLRAHVWGLQQDLQKMSKEKEAVKLTS